jgi:hypothetical protein
MKLRVKEHVPIPHRVILSKIGEISFTPDCEVPDDWGASRLKDSPNIYCEAKGEADLTKYRTTEISMIASFHERFDALNQDERALTLKYMDSLQEKRARALANKLAKEEDEQKKVVRSQEESYARARKEGRA